MNTLSTRRPARAADPAPEPLDGVVDEPLDGMVDEPAPAESTPAEPAAVEDATSETSETTETTETAETAETASPDTAADTAAEDAAGTGAPEAAEGPRSGLRGRAEAVLTRVRAIRPPATRRGRVVLAAVLAVVLLAGAGGGVWWWTTRLPEGVAFRVAGVDVTAADLDQEIRTLRALYGVQAPDPQADPAGADRFRRDVAKASAIGRVVDRAATDAGVVVPDKQVQDFLARYVSQYFGDGGDARRNFVAALGDAGTSEQAVIRELTRQMAASRLFEQVTADLPAVTDADVDAAFAARRDELATPETRALSNLVVADEATAAQLKAQIEGGTPFADVARASSADQATRAQGGAIGTLAAAQLEEGFAQAAFAAPQGTVFGPVQTTHGWNVGTVTAVTPGAPADPAALHEPLRTRLEGERRNDAWRAFLGDRIADADIAYADDHLPADPDGLPQAPGAVPGS